VANVVRITTDGVEDLLNASMYGAGAIVRLQSSSDNVTFANETTAPLVSGTRVYALYDTDGTSSTWYRSRYENAGGTLLSDWSAAFQVGGEEGGQICSLYDVKQRLGIDPSVTSSDEDILELIAAVTVEVESITGRDFTGYRSDVTWRTHTRWGRVLWIPKGIQSVTTLGIATIDQPESGGTYTTVTAGTYYLDPPQFDRDPGWPATRIVMLMTATPFYGASFGAQITGRPGWAEVPANIARIGATAVVSQFLTKGNDTARSVIGPDGRTTILRDISPADRETLMRYAVPLA
jgi:hypothetical protein